MVTNITLRTSHLASFLILLFFILTPLGIYTHTQNYIISIYILISLSFLLFGKNNNEYSHNNIIVYLWLAYVFVSVLSTVVYKRFGTNDLSGIYAEISFTFIICILTKYWNSIYFLKIFKDALLILAFIAIIGVMIRRDPFVFLKQGTSFVSIDVTTNGAISTIFEFRHYYALFLVAAIICLWNFPFKNMAINFICHIILLVNLILTNTRDAWIAFILVLILFLFKRKKISITKNKIIGSFVVLVALIVIFILFSKFINNLFGMIGSRIQEVSGSQNNYGGVAGVRGYTLVNGPKYILDNWTKYLLIGGGNGFAAEWLWYHPFGLLTRWVAAIDVQYVTTFMNSGILGLVLLCTILLINIKKYLMSSTPEGITITLIVISMTIMFFFFDVIPCNNSPLVFWIICICELNTITSKKGKF